MSQTMVVKSFADLPRLLNLDELPQASADTAENVVPEEQEAEPALGIAATGNATVDLLELLAELEAASASLAAIARQDQETRALALRELERYDAVAESLRQAEQARDRASELRIRADRLAAEAFASEAKVAAQQVATLAARSEVVATCHAE